MAYAWHWDVFLQPAAGGGTTYLHWMGMGLATTVALSLAAWLLALVIGGVAGVLRTLPGRLWPRLATAYVELFRNVPLLVQLFLWYFVLPELLPTAWGDAYKGMNPFVQQFVAAWLCLGCFTGARVCEQVRAGIQSLPAGQAQAAQALGLTLAQTYRHVLLPQAGRLIVPPLTSEFLNIFKNSAVASTIGLLELAAQGRQLVDYTAQPYESFIAVTVLYVLINVVVMTAMGRLEQRLHLPGREAGRR